MNFEKNSQFWLLFCDYTKLDFFLFFFRLMKFVFSATNWQNLQFFFCKRLTKIHNFFHNQLMNYTVITRDITRELHNFSSFFQDHLMKTAVWFHEHLTKTAVWFLNHLTKTYVWFQSNLKKTTVWNQDCLRKTDVRFHDR